jgi:hypothetical protein
MPLHAFIFAPTCEIWPASSVNGRLEPIEVGGKQIKASAWLDANQAVEQMTWCPGLPMLIEDKLVVAGTGWIDRNGVRVFNLYRPPTLPRGDASQAGPWIEHVYKVYPDDAEHIILWLAHRVQRPGEKINHALVLGGKQASAKTRCSSPSSARWGRGMSPRPRRKTCSRVSMDF